MAKLNEGDVIEGIFTIGLGLYIAYGKIDKTKLNQIRTKIDPAMFENGRVKYKIAEKIKKQRTGKPADFFNVGIEIKLKPKSSSTAFGKQYEVLYKKSKDVGNIDIKINKLIAQIKTTSFIKKVDNAIDYFLKNNYGEIVNFTVIADGIAGESSGGEIKGDVTLEIYATRKGSTKKIFTEPLYFSLKSESVTVASLSPYRGMLDMAKSMNIKWNAEKDYGRLSKSFKGKAEQKAKFQMIRAMYLELVSRIQKKSSSPSFSKDMFNFLEKNIFGTDIPDVVDVTRAGVKEITKEYFDSLKENVTLKIKPQTGNSLVFIDSETKDPVFQIRTKLLEDRNEAKFYLEIGKGIYNK